MVPGEGHPGAGPAGATDPEDRRSGGSTLTVDAHTLLSGGGALGGLSRPRVAVDGRRHSGRWGRSELSVTPGRHRVEVWVPYPLPRRRGRAAVEIDVAPGETAALEYRVPLWPFLRGSLGPPPQRHRGAWLTLLVVAGAAVALCAAFAWFGATGG